MDPLSIAGSVWGIVEVAAKISLVISRIAAKCKDAPKGITQLQIEVKSLTTALKQLQPLLLIATISGSASEPMVIIEQIIITLSACVITLSEIDRFVEGLDVDEIGLFDRVISISKESEINVFLGRLRDQKSSLTLMLTILSCSSSLAADEVLNSLKTLVGRVLEGQELISQRLASLETRLGVTSIATECPTPQDAVDVQPTTIRPFEAELTKSWAYRRVSRKVYPSYFTVSSSASRSVSWSILSGFSLSKLSTIAVVSLPVYADDISNSNHYMFGEINDLMIQNNPSPIFQLRYSGRCFLRAVLRGIKSLDAIEGVIENSGFDGDSDFVAAGVQVPYRIA